VGYAEVDIHGGHTSQTARPSAASWSTRNKTKTARITAYMHRKVEGYKAQDRRAGRPINNASYVTAEWLINCLGKPCQNCGDCLMVNVSAELSTAT
jgi:hypothetical protein